MDAVVRFFVKRNKKHCLENQKYDQSSVAGTFNLKACSVQGEIKMRAKVNK